MMIILIFRVGFNSSKTRWFSHTGSFIFSCQIAIWRFFTKTVVDYTARFYAMRGRMVKKSWHDSYHFKIVSQKCLKTAKFHQSDIQIHYGIWTVQKQSWYSKARIITRSVSRGRIISHTIHISYTQLSYLIHFETNLYISYKV